MYEPTEQKTKLNIKDCSASSKQIPRILVKDNAIKVSADYRTASHLSRHCILNEVEEKGLQCMQSVQTTDYRTASQLSRHCILNEVEEKGLQCIQKTDSEILFKDNAIKISADYRLQNSLSTVKALYPERS
ncbi:hypothetical protein J6590_082428 [Homalodisca vitripennis]|nr:hypothetical protein J6590_082428 [Homalodisca vitripennis]